MTWPPRAPSGLSHVGRAMLSSTPFVGRAAKQRLGGRVSETVHDMPAALEQEFTPDVEQPHATAPPGADDDSPGWLDPRPSRLDDRRRRLPRVGGLGVRRRRNPVRRAPRCRTREGCDRLAGRARLRHDHEGHRDRELRAGRPDHGGRLSRLVGDQQDGAGRRRPRSLTRRRLPAHARAHVPARRRHRTCRLRAAP